MRGKAACERAFGVIRQRLFELLTGYTGVDVADRGADPEADATLTVEEAEHLIATWVVQVWQQRALGEYAPAWDPGGTHSPNTLFAASFAQAGFAMEIPSPELFYELLPVHYTSRITRRGVKVRGLWYDGDVLEDYRGTASTRGGRHKGQWLIRRDPRDCRQVFFQDPADGAWHALDWTGLPPAGQVPAFGDARARDLLKGAAACGLKPRSDAELLPVLLELIGSKIPVSQWPTRMTKSQRTGHAREVARADAAQADRPSAPASAPAQAPSRPEQASVTPLRWRQRAEQARDGVDADRRRRREAAVPVTPKPRHRWGQATGSATCSSFPAMTRRTMARPAGDDHDSPLVPFLLAGPPPDRTTWEGWQRWRQSRGSFVPAPRLSLAEYQRSAPGAGHCTTCTAPPPT